MLMSEEYGVTVLHKKARKKLKRLALDREQTMSQVLEELIDAAVRQESHHSHS